MEITTNLYKLYKMNELEEDHKQFKAVLDEAAKLRWNKLQCYGKTYDDFGLLGLTIKINDKMGRLKTVTKNVSLDKKIKDENLRDTVIDMLNYCCMWVMVFDDEKNASK